MIREVTYYQAVCDRCGHVDDDPEFGGCSAWSDADSARSVALESDWVEIDGKLVCEICWAWSDDDTEIVVRPPLHVAGEGGE